MYKELREKERKKKYLVLFVSGFELSVENHFAVFFKKKYWHKGGYVVVSKPVLNECHFFFYFAIIQREFARMVSETKRKLMGQGRIEKNSVQNFTRTP